METHIGFSINEHLAFKNIASPIKIDVSGYENVVINGDTTFVENVLDTNGCPKSVTTNVKILVGNNDFEVQDLFTMFPNPAGDYVNFECSADFEQLIVYDIYGKKLRDIDIENTSRQDKLMMDISDFAPGTYMVSVLAGAKSISKRLIVVE